jgi:DNA-binding NtrC family response regulator
MASRVLVIDDEPNITLSFTSLLRDQGYRVEAAASAEEGLDKIRTRSFDLILLDLQLPGMSGLDFLRRMKETSPPVVTIVISGQAEIPDAIEAIKLGAADFLEKPVSPERLIATVGSALLLSAANRQRDVLVEDLDSRCRILGNSPAVKKLLHTVTQVAPVDTTVLITGENGTGKELVASRIYLQSNRRDRPFVKVNCPGIPETLFESELFGHIRGSFTGAVKDHPGKFVLADGGTIFLDEIGDLPPACQAKLLRVLETGEVETLGADTHRVVDVRVICATNRSLEKLVADGRFREDLYYRISVFKIDVPPLRERRGDIPLLIGAFLQQFDPGHATQITPEAMAYLSSADYPGNIRQLRNIIERLTIISRGHAVTIDDVADPVNRNHSKRIESDERQSLSEIMTHYEYTVISSTLSSCGGNISEAARILRVDRANLSRRIKELGLKDS